MIEQEVVRSKRSSLFIPFIQKKKKKKGEGPKTHKKKKKKNKKKRVNCVKRVRVVEVRE